jgi:chromosome segregation ATPase
MSPDEGFIDLRLNRQEGQNQESFWPSFTDIMTVIVMIFMIAMVVLLLRNIELVNQLRATMEAERAAMELAKTTGEEKESLALKLFAAENDLSMMRIRLMRMEEQRKSDESTIGTQSDEITQLKTAVEHFTLRKDQLEAENYTLSENLKRAKTTINAQNQSIATLKENLESTEQRLASTQNQLAATQQELAAAQTDLSHLESDFVSLSQQLENLEQRYKEQASDLQASRLSERRSGRQLNTLQIDYDELKIKYDKLVRPARSPEGRYLVDVRYTRRDGRTLIEFQTEAEPGYREISQLELEERLERLKRSQEQGLYIKVIFPENSGLTFNEAWTFTSRLHSRYDYYYQGQGPELIPIPEPAPTQQ